MASAFEQDDLVLAAGSQSSEGFLTYEPMSREVRMPIAATSVAGSPFLSTPSGAALFDGMPVVRMAVADFDRRSRVGSSIHISHDSQ
jgi:hypothetical protein